MDTVDNQEKPTIMPERIRKWLNQRGITDALIAGHNISYDGRIVIPIYGWNGELLFRKYRRDPEILTGPKYTYDKGATVALYPAKNLKYSGKIVICEGELDALVLESKGFYAITSTGGALSFKEEWAEMFVDKDVYVCFDNDKAGIEGILRIASMIPHAKVVPLFPEVGAHGDITDFFIKLGKTAEDFRSIMEVSIPFPIKKQSIKRLKKRSKPTGNSDLEKAKSIPLTNFLKFNAAGFSKCPMHNEKTPSFKMYPNNRWHCFGCGKGGDVIDLIMFRDSLSIKAAIQKIIG